MVKGQRTKGNTKPSSSRRTAELLGTEAVNSFIGFSSLSSNNTEDEDTDSDFKVVFKKMSKKDGITKVKALQEFQRLVNEKNETIVKTMSMQWPRLYCKLAIDNDWRVREETHKSQEQLVLKIGRNIAPHLKQMVPIWFTSQYDPYSQTASAAVASFDASFPATKKLEALNFTKIPVLNYIKDMLLTQTIESVSEESATAEENTSKYNRLVSNSLQGLTALIVILPSDSLEECQDCVQELINSNKFWKFAKFPDSSIRCSWFKTMSTVAQHLSHLLISNPSKICALTLGGLDEKDFSVISSVWECALLCIITIDDCWKFVNYRKAFYPQLRNILRDGGRGNAFTIFPILLPLLSRIPHESSDKFIEFHKEFFTFLREGLNKTISKTYSESNAIINAYVECIQFCISNTFIDDFQQKTNFDSHLIQNELLVLVKDSISNNENLSKTSLYNNLALFWLFLRKGDKHKQLIQQISDELVYFCSENIKENNWKSFSRISYLFNNLFCDLSSLKKDKRIRFRRNSDDDGYKIAQNMKFNDLVNDSNAIITVNKINKFLIESYCLDYSKYQYLELLVDLFRVNTKDNFENFLKFLNLSFDKFWSDFVKQWINQFVRNNCEEKSQRIKTLIDLILILLNFVEEKNEKYFILDEVLSLNDPILSEILISSSISSNEKYLSDWLKTESTGNSIVKLTSELMDNFIHSNTLTQQNSEILWKLISHCFADNSFNKLYIEGVINNFRICLQNNCRSSSKRELLIEFVCRLASQLFSCYDLCTSLSSARELLVTIFSINCRFDDPNQQLLNAWKTGLTNIIKSNGGYLSEDGLVSQLAANVKSRLNSNITSIENAEIVFSCGLELIDTFNNALKIYDSEEDVKKALLSDPNIIFILDSMLLSNNEWKELQSKCDESILHYDWLNRDILIDVNNCQMISSDSFDKNGVPFVFSAVSTALLLEKLMENHSNNEYNPEFCDLLTNQMKYLLNACSYLSIKSKSEKLKVFSSILTILKENITKILEKTKNQRFITKMQTLLLELSHNERTNWSQTYSYFINNFVDNFDEIQFQLSIDNLNYNQIITFQELSSHLPQNLLNEYLVQSLNAFVCCEHFIELEDGIGKLAVLHSCLKFLESNSSDINETVNTILETFCGLKSSNLDQFYYKDDIEANSELQFYCLICQVFDVIINKYSDILEQKFWDLIFISSTNWIQNIIRQNQNIDKHLSLNIFATKVFKLIQTLTTSFENLTENECKERYSEQLFIEWQEFHSKNIFDHLIRFYFHFSESEMNFYEEILFNFVSKVVVLIPYSLLIEWLSHIENEEPLPLKSNDKEYKSLYLPPEKEKVFNMFCPLLLKSHLPIALSSHQLIFRLIPSLLKDVIQPEFQTKDEEIYLSPPKTLLSLLERTDFIVDSMLSEYSIDCCCVVEPQTDSFTYTFAYLLLWVEILELFANFCEENPTLRPKMIAFLKENSLLSHLLKNLFRLMPLSTNNTKILSEELFDKNFTKYSIVSTDETINSIHIQRLAFHLYYLILKQLPAAVREWFKYSDRRTTDIVNEITTNHFSGIVCSQELEAVQRVDSNKFNNMSIRARLSVREVVVKYTFEEMSFELSIHFPNNYPLNDIKIDCIKRFGIKADVWRKWILQLTTYLNYQDGSILDALTIFKKNIDKQFEGVDECMICFYVLHGRDYSLPNKFCSHCKKSFHSECLHKWFRTSNNTLCPLCRQLWNFYNSIRS